MFQMCVFYRSPIDPAAFDEHYVTTHREIVSRLPGLRHATINWPETPVADDPAPYHVVTVLYWDDRASSTAALDSPTGVEAAADAFRLPRAESFSTYAASDVKIGFTPFSPGSEIRGVLGLYGPPADDAHFRAHYEGTHSLLASKMPRQAAFTVSWTTPDPNGQPSPYHLIGNQEWKDQADLDYCLASPEATAAIADLENFVEGHGMTMLSCRTIVVV